jgi:hypothetical protein
MKFILSVICIALFTFSSCKKDCPTTTPTQVKTPEELLTARTWKLDDMRILRSNGTTDYYKRGGTSNTFNGDADSLKFNLNNTGVFHDFLGATYTTTWSFTNSEKTKMTLVINKTSPLTLMIEDIALAESYFSYSHYATDPIYYLASSRRIPN